MPSFDQQALMDLGEDLANEHLAADAALERGAPITDWDDLACVVHTLGAAGSLPPDVLLGHLEAVFSQLSDVQVGEQTSLYLTMPERTDRQIGFAPWMRSRQLHPTEQALIAQAAMLACLRSGARSAELLPDASAVRAQWGTPERAED